MRAVVVYESMYGNTRFVAEQIATGLRSRCDVQIIPVHEATEDLTAQADLVVAGGPTHIHGMSSSKSRAQAVAAAGKPVGGLTVEPDAAGPGLRDWFATLSQVSGKSAAAFDTRLEAAALLTGRASHGIAHRLRKHGFLLIVEPESFLVTKQDRLADGEADRARQWGADLADTLVRS